jgi:hypothetical protein
MRINLELLPLQVYFFAVSSFGLAPDLKLSDITSALSSGLILKPSEKGTHSWFGVFEYCSDWDSFPRHGYKLFDDMITCEVTLT